MPRFDVAKIFRPEARNKSTNRQVLQALDGKMEALTQAPRLGISGEALHQPLGFLRETAQTIAGLNWETLKDQPLEERSGQVHTTIRAEGGKKDPHVKVATFTRTNLSAEWETIEVRQTQTQVGRRGEKQTVTTTDFTVVRTDGITERFTILNDGKDQHVQGSPSPEFDEAARTRRVLHAIDEAVEEGAFTEDLRIANYQDEGSGIPRSREVPASILTLAVNLDQLYKGLTATGTRELIDTLPADRDNYDTKATIQEINGGSEQLIVVSRNKLDGSEVALRYHDFGKGGNGRLEVDVELVDPVGAVNGPMYGVFLERQAEEIIPISIDLRQHEDTRRFIVQRTETVE